MLVTSAEVFSIAAEPILSKAHGACVYEEERRFRGVFGVSREVCSFAWNRIRTNVPKSGKSKHLLWALLLLCHYATERSMRSCLGACERTVRKWSWLFIELLAGLETVRNCLFRTRNQANSSQIKWSARLLCNSAPNVNASVDGTDSRIDEPSPDFGYLVLTLVSRSRCSLWSRNIYSEWSYRIDRGPLPGWLLVRSKNFFKIIWKLAYSLENL